MSTPIDQTSLSVKQLLIISNHDNSINNMCYGKLLENVSPVRDIADLHVSTLHFSPGSYRQ